MRADVFVMSASRMRFTRCPAREKSRRCPARKKGGWLLLLALVLIAGCETPTEIVDIRRDAGPQAECRAVEVGAVACEGEMSLRCDESGHVNERIDCAERGQVCVPRLGCSMCAPYRVRCDGELVLRCNAAGTAETEEATCDAAAGLHCSPLGCQPLCAQAEEAHSYLGCAYYAVPTTNSYLDPVFYFAVAIANPQLVPAEVTIDGGADVHEVRTIEPGALELVRLPWIESLRQPVVAEDHFSVRATVPAYRIESNVPVTVHQFNPLTFSEPVNCTSGSEGGRCFSYTNDASLLLPTHALTGSYLLMSRAAHLVTAGTARSASPGFVTIVGAGTETIPVTVRTHAYIAGGIDGVMQRHVPGENFTLMLAPGEVIQLVTEVPARCPVTPVFDGVNEVCPLGSDYDLTGTEVVANGPIAVFAGHNCAFAPFDRWACDHLEEQIFPSEALGLSVVAPMSMQQRGEPHLLRVVSAANGNVITFSPTREDAPSIVLNRGEFTEIVMSVPMRVTGTAPLLAARFFVGQDYNGLGSSGRAATGDPSMGLLVPDEQWRREYVFLAPATYTTTFVDIIAPATARVELDAQVVGAFRAAAGTGFSIARVALRPGVHRITANYPVGVQVYGYAPYTSYLVPGGLDLVEIAEPL